MSSHWPGSSGSAAPGRRRFDPPRRAPGTRVVPQRMVRSPGLRQPRPPTRPAKMSRAAVTKPTLYPPGIPANRSPAPASVCFGLLAQVSWARPLASFLADLGAEVIQVEPNPDGDRTRRLPGSGAEVSSRSQRNKNGLAIDLKRTRKRRSLSRPRRHGRLVFDNSRPGTIERPGLRWSELSVAIRG